MVERVATLVSVASVPLKSVVFASNHPPTRTPSELVARIPVVQVSITSPTATMLRIVLSSSSPLVALLMYTLFSWGDTVAVAPLSISSAPCPTLVAQL